MNSKWFDFEKELSPELFTNSDRFETFRKNFGLTTKRMGSEKLKSWSSVNKVSDILDLETGRMASLNDRNSRWDSVIRDRLMGNTLPGTKLHNPREYLPTSGRDCDEILSDVTENTRRIRNRFSREWFDLEPEIDNGRTNKMKYQTNRADKSYSCNSNNNYGFTDSTSKRMSEERAWGRKSSCHGDITFPESSDASMNSDPASEKSFGRSISINSEESVCTEKSADCSTISEMLPDGTSKTQFENNETRVKKSTSGSTVCERVKDSTVTEKKDDKVCDKSSKKTSYLERSATGSSLKEESTSERMISRDKSGTKTVEQKTSSEIYKKAYRSPKNANTFYDELDSCSFQHRLPNFPKSVSGEEMQKKRDLDCGTGGKTVSEKISKLIDEAVHQDNLFKIPFRLETDIDKMTSDFIDLKSYFGKEKRRQERRRISGTFSQAEKSDGDLTWSKFNELKAENESILQENSKLQSIIQDVTAVNKRWQKYNNERRMYVQKLLSTIQDLQEQINFISEKSAFHSNSSQNDSNLLYEDIEKLKREYQEHITLLELQIKSHKDDWDAERKEKQKAVHEKEDLERKVQELMREVKFLKNVLLEEKKRKLTFCRSCRNNLDDSMVFPKSEFFPDTSSLNMTSAFLPKTFRTAVHVPYKTNEISSERHYFSEDYQSKEESDSPKTTLTNVEDSFLNERFSECTNFSQIKKTSGDTIVVEDENGLRLSITEQFPSKDTHQLKSILKKNDKRIKLLSKSVSEQTDIKNTNEVRSLTKIHKSSNDERNITCEEHESQSSSNCALSIGFEKDGWAKITSFSSYPIADNDALQYVYPLPIENNEFLKISMYNRSKSEPNTRSNSSENLIPLRESSSWNNQCPGGDINARESIVCSGCNRSFSPSMHLQFLNHFESCSKQMNHF